MNPNLIFEKFYNVFEKPNYKFKLIIVSFIFKKINFLVELSLLKGFK